MRRDEPVAEIRRREIPSKKELETSNDIQARGMVWQV
jgi:hypothetical protein